MADLPSRDAELAAVRERFTTFDTLVLRTIAQDDGHEFCELATDELRRRGVAVEGFNAFAVTTSTADKLRELGEL